MPNYKYCIVPKCTNTSISTPRKLFFNVPKDPKLRKKWCTVMKRDDKTPLSCKASRFCCEDHFDVEADMENYVKFKLVGGMLRLKKEVLPHKFDCQKHQKNTAGFKKRSTNSKHFPNEELYLECATSEQKIEVVKQEHTEMNIESCNDDEEDHDESRIEMDTLCETQVDEEIDVLKQEQIEETIKSDDDDKKYDDDSSSDPLRQTSVNEELWVVRRQLCRCCHSEGAFWSLQTTTEGDTYGDLLQTYYNIQLCPVSQDEFALSAICALCAARLRDARAFSAQAHAAEERFTRFYKQNRIRALVNEEEIKKDVPKIKNEIDDCKMTDDVESDTANPNLDNPEFSKDEFAPKQNRKKQSQARRQKAKSKKLLHLSPSDYERVGNLFKCTRCGELYCESGINEHVNNMHLKPPKYICPHCDKTFMKLGEFRCHKEEHSIFDGKSKQNFKFSASDFKRVGESYQCNRCKKQFKNYKYISLHVRHTHFKIPRKNYTCLYCDKTFHLIRPYTKHKLEKHLVDDRIKCDACDWFTYRKSELNKHKKGYHMLGEKKTCPDCDYFCFSEGALKKHAVKHSTVKKYHCGYCKKSFLRKSNLNFHERIHTGDKRKVCNVCGQAFVQRASLTYHMAKHHPEVRF